MGKLTGVPYRAANPYHQAMTAFGERMEGLRKARGMSLRALAAAVGMSVGNVHKILSGRHGKSVEENHNRQRPPTPPLGTDLQMWFDVLGTSRAEEPLLRLLAAAAHVPDDIARQELEDLLVKSVIPMDPELPAVALEPRPVSPVRRVTIPRRAAEAEAMPVESTRPTDG